MLVLVCGSRSWPHPQVIYRRIKKLPYGVEIIHGGATGADAQAGIAADYFGLKTRIFPPDWKRHGRGAGIVRNLQMLDEKPDLVLAFWDGKSTGTKHTIDEAEQRGIKVEIVYEQGGTDWR